MKKLLLTIALASVVSVGFADITGSGYYRVKNYGSQRWASLIDNKGEVDKVAATADLHALQLSNDTEVTLSDPGSIVYLQNISGNQYNVSAQGTSLQSLIDNPVYIGSEGSADGQKLYYIWGTYQNITKYVADANTVVSQEYGKATINEIGDKNINFKKWLFLPVDVTSDNYFGAVPSVTAMGNGYCSMFTSFAYKPYSEGVKAYYIGRVGFGMAEMIEITNAVPPGSPVIIQCAGATAAQNKLRLVESQDVLPNNSLSGVYFNYHYGSISNRVAYNAATMRVLGTCSDGSIGFVTANLDYIPANTAYLKVPEGSPAEFKCVDSATYTANLPEAPEVIYFGDNTLQPQDDYTYSGTFYYDAGSNPTFLFYTSASQNPADAIGAIGSGNIQMNLSKSGRYGFEYGSQFAWYVNNWMGGDITVTLNLQYQYVSFSSKAAGVETLTADNSSLRYNGKTIYSEAGNDIKVVNMEGRTVAHSSDGTLDVSSLPKGIYVAISNGKSIKIMR